MTPLKHARIARGWTQERLARAAGLPQPTIARAERNGSATTDSALRIARAMGSTVEALFAFDDAPDETPATEAAA